MAVHPSMFFNGVCCLEYQGRYAEIIIGSHADASVGVELYYPNSQATYEGQLPPVLLQEGNIRFHVSSCLVW
jgi:hypothetical protein